MKLKSLLPFERYKLTTALSPEEVINRIAANTGPEKWNGLFKSDFRTDKLYEGKITGHTFYIRRMIGYRNSFLPRISGVATAA